jgi:transcription elongation GreA/GreB family factor
MFKKQELIEEIVRQLTAELELFFRAAKAAHAEATHEQSKAENKYDTRGLEAAYLARGQSKQAAELAAAISQFQALKAREFGPKDAIDVGAVVELRDKRDHSWYFVGPAGGGTEIQHDGKEVLVITSQSPIGKELVGQLQGHAFELVIGGEKRKYKIQTVF